MEHRDKMFRARLISWYLIFMLVFTMMPVDVFAQQQTTGTDMVNISLTIDGHSHRGELVGENFVKEKLVSIVKGSTVKDLIVKYCKDNDVKYELNGETYLSSLYDLAEKEYGDDSGWTYYVYDKVKDKYVFADKGINDYSLQEDTKVKIVYTVENYFPKKYQAEKTKTREIAEALLKNIEKDEMSGYTSSMLFHVGEVPNTYKNKVKEKVEALNESSSVAQYYETILSVLSIGENPYAVWGRKLIDEVAKRDVLNGSIEDMTYAIAIVNAGEFELPEGTNWSVKALQKKLKEVQNADGSFGQGSEKEKVILTAKVYNFADFSVSDTKTFGRMEDYLALQMHPAGGLPLSKEDGLATAQVVLAMANRSQNPYGRISYREQGSWTAGKNPSPLQSLFDFYVDSKKGFRRDLLSKDIDKETTEVATLAMERTNKYFEPGNPFGGRSFFKFGKIAPPKDVDEDRLWIDRTYEEILADRRSDDKISEEAAYILKRMGETLRSEQLKALKDKVDLEPKTTKKAYLSVMASIASDSGRESVEKIARAIEKMPMRQYVSPSKTVHGIIAGNMAGNQFGKEKSEELNKVLLRYKLFKANQTLFPSDDFLAFAAAVTLIDKEEEKNHFIANLQKLISTKNFAELTKRDTGAKLAGAVTLLGENIFDPKYTTKDGKSLIDLLKQSEKSSDFTFFALASYKLKQVDGSNLFQYQFEPSMEENVNETIQKYIDVVELPTHVIKKYDEGRDISEEIQKIKKRLKEKNYKLSPKNDRITWFDLIAGGEDLQNIDGHNLIHNFVKESQGPRKIMNINSLTILNTVNYRSALSDKETKEGLKEKVIGIKEFQENPTGKISISDAGWAMIALAPYYKEGDEKTVKVVDRFLDKVSKAVKSDGTVAQIGQTSVELPYRSDELARLVQGLIHLGIDPAKDPRFIKNGNSVLGALLKYELPTGGFSYDYGKKEEGQATKAIVETLVDYSLFLQEKPLLYHYKAISAPPVEEMKYGVDIIISPEEAKDVILVVTEKGKEEVIEKGEKGYRLKEGTYVLRASKKGYKSLEKEFNVSSDSSTHRVELKMEKIVENPFVFDISTNTIKGYKTMNVPEHLVIPSEIEGVKVKHIGREAFLYGSFNKKINKPLKSIDLPEGLESIGESAFQGSEFTQIRIPSTVKEIHGSFRLCKKLEEVNFAANSQLKIIGKDSFYGSKIREIVIPNTVEVIGNMAFHDSALKKIDIPDSVKEIGASAFGLTNIQEFRIPRGVQKLNFDERGNQSRNGLFFRTFEDEGRKQLSFTRVFDESGIATLDNTRAIVNPVKVTIRYVDKSTGAEIEGRPSVTAVGMNKKTVSDFGGYKKPVIIKDGDRSFILDYKNPYTDTKVYSDKKSNEVRDAVFGNYFIKNSQWTFDAPEIDGYTNPSSITRNLVKEEEEIVFQYQAIDKKYRLDLQGEGLTSSVSGGEIDSNTLVEILIAPPKGKVFKKLLVNDEMAEVLKEGLKHKYSFRIQRDTKVKVEYDEVGYDKELKLTVGKSELKLGEKTGIQVSWRSQDVDLPNSDIVFDYDRNILALDEKTGEVTAIGSGTVELTAKLKTDETAKDSQRLQVNPVKVNVRVEDVNRTEIEPVEVSITSLKVREGVDYYKNITFEKPVAFLAIKEAVKLAGKDTSKQSVLDCGDNAGWMKVINELNPNTAYGKNSSFMCTVNDKMANVGVGEFEVNEGDDIVVYVSQDWQKSDGYAYFENKEYSVQAGKELEIKLLRISFDVEGVVPFSGATLLNNTEVLKDKSDRPIVSGSDGVFRHTFTQEGRYRISANKVSEKVNRISRPYAIVHVNAAPLQPKTIQTVREVEAISVEKGTAKTSLNLPGSIEATLSDNTKVNLSLTWKEESEPKYNADLAGDYLFTAEYELPEGVTGEKPKVTVVVTVKEGTAPSPAESLDELLAWARQKMDAIADNYASKEKTGDLWKIAEIGKLEREIKSADFDYIKTQLFKDGDLKKDVGTLSKAILALRAAGIDPQSYYGYDLVEELIHIDAGDSMWTVAPKLWALSSDNYPSAREEIEKLLKTILGSQNTQGLWEEWGYWEDTTGAALYALSPYYDREEVKVAIEKAVDVISEKQKEDGDIADNSNSLVMVAGGLWSCEPQYLTDPRLVKNGNTLLHAVKKYEVEKSIDFTWKLTEKKANPLATEQTVRALISLFGKREGKGYVFDYSAKSKVEKPLPFIQEISTVSAISVEWGTEEEVAKEKLQKELLIKDSEGNYHSVFLKWMVEHYNKEMAGQYKAEGRFELPQKVIQSNPPMSLFVQTFITVLEKGKEEEKPQVDKETLKQLILKLDSEKLEAQDYTEQSYLEFQRQYQKAKEILLKEDASQQEVDQVLVDLQNARQKLQKKPEMIDSPSHQSKNEITVTFSLKGMQYQGTQEEIWIPKESVTVPEGSNVYKAFETALNRHNISFTNKGNYISEIKSPITGQRLAEFTNGRYSGWMYQVNGIQPDKGVEEYVLSDGDNIFFYYTNDYRNEPGSETWKVENSSGGKKENQKGNTKIQTEVKDGIVKSVPNETFKKLLELSIKEVKEQESPVVFLDVRTDKKVKEIQMKLDGESIQKITEQKQMSLGMKSNLLELIFDKKAMEIIQGAEKQSKEGILVVISQENNAQSVLSKASDIQEGITEAQKKEVQNILGERPVFDITVKTSEGNVSDYRGGRITVKLPYKLNPGEEKDSLTAYRLEEGGKLVEMKDSSYDAIEGIMSFTTDHLSYYAVGEKKEEAQEQIYFADVEKNKWYSEAIHALAKEGILKGKEGNKFYPNEEITRAEFVTLLWKHSKEESKKEMARGYEDVSSTAWYYPAILWAEEKGIAKGYGKQFKPDEKINREEMAVMIANYAKYSEKINLSEEGTEPDFKDSSKISKWAKPSINLMFKNGVIRGKEGARFAPKERASRAEAAQMIYSLLMK